MKRSGNVLKTIRGALNAAIAWKRTPAIVLIVFCAFLFMPLYWTLVTSLKTTKEIFSWPPTLFPKSLTLGHYVKALIHSPIFGNILNSIFYSLTATVIVVTVAALTTYGFSVYQYRGSTKVALVFLGTRIIPPQSLFVPFVVLFSKLGLINTRPAVIIFQFVLVYPLSIWLLKGIFDKFPRELVDAARIDGASRIFTLLKVVLPIVAPGIGAVAIIAFLWTWNAFMFPFLILNSPQLKPITVGIFHFVSDRGIEWGPMAASSVLAIIPGVVFFIFAQRSIVSGLTLGAVKS
ncbi:MAG: carbohydrate ABC transporter permease [Planctomycetes bacterium]|nr:carbohydrate ABC transporter permease [Planctomycetota bacterium]